MNTHINQVLIEIERQQEAIEHERRAAQIVRSVAGVVGVASTAAAGLVIGISATGELATTILIAGLCAIALAAVLVAVAGSVEVARNAEALRALGAMRARIVASTPTLHRSWRSDTAEYLRRWRYNNGKQMPKN
jgi:hypothetical protein